MTHPPKHYPLSEADLRTAISLESKELEFSFRWLEEHLPPSFAEEVSLQKRLIIARSLLSFQIQDRFSNIHLKHLAILLCPDAPDVDLKILKTYAGYVIHYYRTFISDAPPPGEKEGLLRIALLYLRDEPKEEVDMHETIEPERREELVQLIQQRNKEFHAKHLETLLHGMTPRFVRSLKNGRLALAVDMFFRAQTSDECQYEIRENLDWKEKKLPSLQIVLAWRAVPKSSFLYRLAKITLAHGLHLRKVVATYIDPYSEENILLLSMGVHGIDGKAAWDATDIDDFLSELCLLKYFETEDKIEEVFVKTKRLSGNEAHLLRNFSAFTHQALLHKDPHLYSFENIGEGLCRHPELTVQLCHLFRAKFHPHEDGKQYKEKQKKILQLIDQLDTGQATNDLRRKNILRTTLNFIEYTLKTNFYGHNKSGFSFRLDPLYLDALPFDRKEKFPSLPYAIFFIRGMHFIGFNIRFKDLSRGGVRSVMPDREESYNHERNNIFAEAYNLSFTQHKKNKDIPEGGAKTVILLEPLDSLAKEDELFAQEMMRDGMSEAVIEERLKISRRKHKLAYLYAAQRSFIECFMTLLNCDDKGKLKAKYVVDYLQKPEYIYLGPDENMHNDMIVWIADFAQRVGYRPGRSFMSSKPNAGINHKEYGVTSYGVHVYLQQTLRFLGIDPEKDPFTVKISGGPDGDVAGNEIHLLGMQYAKTAKLVALTDVSGTIFDPEGLDWQEMETLFQKGLPIRFYPHEKLHEGGFLLDLQTKRQESAYAQQTLLWRKKDQKSEEEWISGNDMNHLFRNNVHQVQADIFVPGGGRPRTLNELNVASFLNEAGAPTARAIVEGANLYLTPEARRYLENLGTVVLKDSSCNKGGVICSSFEVLAGLCMTEIEFCQEKEEYVKEVLHIIRQAALSEANLILETHRKTGAHFTDLSEKVSERINLFKYQLLDHLMMIDLSPDPKDPLQRCLLLYCPPLLRKKYGDKIRNLPEIHKKAMIAVFLASHLVYTRGLSWSPSVADILSNIATDPTITGH